MRCLMTAIVLLVLCSANSSPAEEQSSSNKPSAEQLRAWRAEGPAAVDRLMVERDKLIAAAKSLSGNKRYPTAVEIPYEEPVPQAAWERVLAINETIDSVAGARYSHESGLYWYTDEEEAKRVAKQQGKPLLALRLLGNLDDELSCANSRYFRILLYPDDKVRKLLHDKFILTWKSVRPVPKITIDLGDGRKVERTITGNSVHYVVLPDGQVVDVFPGLYGPVPFCERLEKAHAVAKRAICAADSPALLKEYWQQRIAELEKAWQVDVARYEELQRQHKQLEPDRKRVGLVPSQSPSFWEVAAKFHPEYSELSKASERLVREEAKMGEIRGREDLRPNQDLDFAFSKGGDESALSALLACVQPALQADTIHNEYRGRYMALRHLSGITDPFASPFDDDGPSLSRSPIGPQREPVDILNDYVYTEIFHYNPDDPWIGLARLNSLTALPKDRGLKSATVVEK